ncbi:hypothetical protein AGATL06_24900 [Agathobaculum sp. TL06]
MEQIPYACGRLGELAQDIRWRAGQLPALREADGAADLRQIAQQIQKLVSALSESVLLLEELDLPKVSAYTAQLSAAVSGFHIQTPDYTKLVSAFLDWLAYIQPLLPDAETKTVSAAAIGRQMNHVRLGYYPTDPAHVAYIRRALIFPAGKTVNLLDPCCGEGNALSQLGTGENAVTYGAELDDSRAEAAQEKLDHVAMGSYYFSRISRSAYHLLFLNPPYLQVYGGARSEKRFLGESYDHLMMGGVLVYIIPYHRLTEDVCRFLAAHFARLMAYRFCGEEFQKFRQIAVLGVRKPRAEVPRVARLLELASLLPDKLPTLDQIPPGSYPLPEAEKAVSLFQGARFNVRELQEQMRRMGSMLPQRSALDGQEKRPPLPLTIGQIGLAGGSGLINGLIACDAPHVLKGRVVKAVRRRTGEQYDETDGSTTTELIETTSNQMVFNVLTPQGVKLLA